ncbi:MAG: putative Tubulin polyglutamylase TTLL5 [Streblomastix strix]|uniref:Putative Tubulin polyglutamylase TTLL5 n=1 Tax=Streblomastix strix TaxID=222440 RepID=A0A5J4W4S4_9EUKA|nr:MAG: putative Tubulin polyglutamylase TTLL5 [Streblomastix strix]
MARFFKKLILRNYILILISYPQMRSTGSEKKKIQGLRLLPSIFAEIPPCIVFSQDLELLYIMADDDTLQPLLKTTSSCPETVREVLVGRAHALFFPRTFIFPRDNELFKCEIISKKQENPFIIKPVAASRGIGIHVVSTSNEVQLTSDTLAQEYIQRPLLIGGRKLDIRLYILIMGYNPLRIYLYRDGIVRFASEEYSLDSKSPHAHLTNYSINKSKIIEGEKKEKERQLRIMKKEKEKNERIQKRKERLEQ